MGHNGPGVVVLDADEGVVLRNAAAHAAMDDLCGCGASGDPVRTIVARLRDAGPGTRRGTAAAIRVRGGSGMWYELTASWAEAGAVSAGRAVVTIDRVPSGPRIPIRPCGLTPREREIAEMAALGASTKAIAATLGLSPYTVQEHVGHACQKMGVRGRRALVARIFFEDRAHEEATD